MNDLDLRDGAPLWARVIWCLVRKAAGAAPGLLLNFLAGQQLHNMVHL